MGTLADAVKVVRSEFKFINDIGSRLRGTPYCVKSDLASTNITEHFAGLEQLFSSLASASPTARANKDRAVEEWNPISQRLLLSDESPVAAPGIESNFAYVSSYFQTFVEWAHEAVHIFTFEPFFCGAVDLGSESAFVNWNRASEAAAFWYADICMTPEIRRSISGAELVYNRRALSNASFHPETVFRQIGVESTTEILHIYLRSFLGAPTILDTSRGPYPEAFLRGVREFYSNSADDVSRWKRVLDRMDIFGGYVERFCAKPNLPSLCSGEALSIMSSATVGESIVSLMTERLPELAHMSRSEVARIAARRHIQTRAYFSWTLHQALTQGWVSFSRSAVDLPVLLRGVSAHLNGLEAALSSLASGQNVGEVMQLVRIGDEKYEGRVRKALSEARAHVKYRYFLYPYFEPSGGLVGVADSVTDLSRDEMLAIIGMLSARFSWAQGFSSGVAKELIQLLHHLLDLLDKGDTVQVRAAFNSFMTNPHVLELWSVKLANVDPLQNSFREITYEYT